MTIEPIPIEPMEYGEGLGAFAKEVRTLRIKYLAELDTAGADPESEQFYLLALDSLDSAERFLALATYKQRQGIRGFVR
jgi:hypothetical protein